MLAAVVEMIHTATLVHDDVLDEASLRRHLETINARNDNEASVLVGDFLFTHAFYLASSLETTYACQTIGRATNIVCAGELRQINSRGNFELSEEDVPFDHRGQDRRAVRLLLPAGRPLCRRQRSLRGLRSIAMAATWASPFKSPTTCWTWSANEDSMGKSLGTDLEKQKLTLPVIRLLAECGASERSEILELLSSNSRADRSQVNVWLERGDALAYADQRARHYAERARAETEHLPPSAARDVLALLCELVVNRQD